MTAVDYSSLPEQMRTKVHQRLTPRSNRYIPPTLTTDNRNLKQRAFLLIEDREAFYGGAAGGAKTSGILAAALQWCDSPGYHALLLRRNYKQLSMPGSWIPLSHEWLDHTDAHWHEGAKQWRFPSGATLTFGFVGLNRDDVRKYETAAFSFIGIDELTAWDEADYTFLFSRLRRRAEVRAPSRMRCASNPGGRGHEWVKRRFVDPVTRQTRAIFLPALLTDNPYLDQADYIQSLQELHPIHWRRLLYGDWEVSDPGEMFQPRIWLGEHDFLSESPARVAARVRYWDLAASEPTASNPDPDWTVGFRMSRIADDDGRPLWVMEHVVRKRHASGSVEKLVANTARTDPPGTRQWMEQEPGASGKSLVDYYKRKVMPPTIPLRALPARTSKGERARPWAGAMENGRIRCVRGQWNEALFDEQEAFSEDPSHSGLHDDQVDAGSGAFDRLKTSGDRRGMTVAGRSL